MNNDDMNKKMENTINNAPNNMAIFDSLVKANQIINNKNFKNIAVGISGGSDSDVLLDLVERVNINSNIYYIFFDTGLEYDETHKHLKDLEAKYNIKIIKLRAKKPIPKAVREYGVPFLSKRVSENISRLQKHNFDFKDGENLTFEQALEKYCEKKLNPRTGKIGYIGCYSALAWFYNQNSIKDDEGNVIKQSPMDISYNRGLREFLIYNPPTFKISQKCCEWAKKKVSKDFLKEYDIDCNLTGVRKAEKGARKSNYKTCFDHNCKCGSDNIDQCSCLANYRPILFYSDIDKQEYNKHYGIINNKCYTEYGLTRTGCVACPFGLKFEEELKVVEEYEPKFSKAVNKTFKDSYEYTRKYRIFREKLKLSDIENKNKKN